MIGILSLGSGNVASIRNMFDRLDVQTASVREKDDLTGITTLLIPGVGAFDETASVIAQRGLSSVIKKFSRHSYVVGICLGMQLLLDESEEGSRRLPGLGIIPGVVKRIDEKWLPRVPNVGWDEITSAEDQTNDELTAILTRNRFYFSHSYVASPSSAKNVIAHASSSQKVIASIQSGKTLGFQFHPERSQRGGMELFDWLARRDENVNR